MLVRQSQVETFQFKSLLINFKNFSELTQLGIP